MLRRVMLLLAAPVVVAAQNGPSGSVEIPVSASAVSVSLSSHAYQLIASQADGKEHLIRGGGALAYNLNPEDRVSIAATDSAATLHVELKDQGRIVAFANGRSVTLRRHDGLLIVDTRKDGPLAPTPRPPGQE